MRGHQDQGKPQQGAEGPPDSRQQGQPKSKVIPPQPVPLPPAHPASQRPVTGLISLLLTANSLQLHHLSARKLRGQGLTDQPGLPSAPSTSVLRLSQAWNLGDSQAGAKSPPASTQHPAQDDAYSQAWGLEACFPPLCTGGNDDPAHRGIGGCTSARTRLPAGRKLCSGETAWFSLQQGPAHRPLSCQDQILTAWKLAEATCTVPRRGTSPRKMSRGLMLPPTLWGLAQMHTSAE